MKCRYCGAQLREGTAFCHECGRPVDYNEKQNGNPYVLITGSKINLDDKAEIYQKAMHLQYELIRRPFISYIPILGLPYLLELRTEEIETEDKLLGFKNQKNIANAILIDLIWEKLYKIRSSVNWLIVTNIIGIFILILVAALMMFIGSIVLKMRSFF